MNRAEFEKYILETYNCDKDYPWVKYPSFAVFRHKSKKWFAVVMDIPKEKVGLQDSGIISVVNLKCDTLLIGTLIKEEGIFPAYHMSKTHWLTVSLDGNVPDDTVKMLTDISFELTMPKNKKSKQN